MARTNVEDEWFVDVTGKRAALIQAVQLSAANWADAADGMALRAWRLAQRFWKDNERLIPETDWKRAKLEPLIECDLAERRPDGIYVRGTKEQHDWLLQRVNAGKERAKGDRDEHGRFKPKSPSDGPAESSETSSTAGSLDQPLPPAPTLPPTLPPAPTHALPHGPEEIPPNGGTSSSSTRGRRLGPSPRELAQLWNEVSDPAMRKVDLGEFKSDSGRWTAASARIRSKPDLGYWRQVIERLNKSPFWRGEVDPPEGRKRFIGNFDTLVRRDTHLRAMDGLYDEQGTSDGFKESLDRWTAEMKAKGVQ